jgi:hypothetical protein
MHIYTVRAIKLNVYTLIIGGYKFGEDNSYHNFPEWENLLLMYSMSSKSTLKKTKNSQFLFIVKFEAFIILVLWARGPEVFTSGPIGPGKALFPLGKMQNAPHTAKLFPLHTAYMLHCVMYILQVYIRNSIVFGNVKNYFNIFLLTLYTVKKG